jgi:uncharacterized membrane protein YfcA
MTSASITTQFRYFTPALFIFTAVWLVIYIGFFPDPGKLAAQNWPLILVGVVGAVIGNITAIGGGLVFIPVLMFVYHTDPLSALKLAFVTQAVGMTSGATGWLKRGEVPLHLLKWTIPSLIIGTLIATFLLHPNGIVVKSLFGPVSLIAGVLTLVTLNRVGSVDELPRKAMLPVFIVSIIGGLITGWVAIGEGEIIAAFCMLAYGLRATKAIGLGVVLLAINSILLALLHSLYFGGVPWDMAIFTMLGVLWGGRLGPWLTQWISAKQSKLVFACIAILDGALITWQALRSLF